MCETQVKIMNYLANKVKNGEKLPSLSDLSKELNINYVTKEIVCEYIKNIDASSFTNENINKTLTSITLITNKIKDKLFK